MPWPMSCPPGEDRSLGEGAASSHWASIILLVAVTPCADRTSGRRTCICPGLTFLRALAYFLSDPVTGTVHAPMQSDAAGLFQCRGLVHNPAATEAWNQATYGVCNNPNYHGHNYELDLSVEGEINPETGYVMDLNHLKELAQERLLR